MGNASSICCGLGTTQMAQDQTAVTSNVGISMNPAAQELLYPGNRSAIVNVTAAPQQTAHSGRSIVPKSKPGSGVSAHLPSEYRPHDVSVEELAVPRERLRFGNDLQGKSIDCTPLNAYEAKVRAPSSQESETGVFYQVDAQTFVRARDRALQAQGERARDVLPRSAPYYEQMGAKLYLTGSGGGGIATTKPRPDGRVELISGFNMPKSAERLESLELTMRGVTKLDNVNVQECMQGLAPQRLSLYGWRSVATLPITERLPPDWPQDRIGEHIHSLVLIPDHLVGSSTLDAPAVQCTSQEEFYKVGRQAYERMYEVRERSVR